MSWAASVKSHPRLEVTVGEESVTYIPSSQEDADPLCLRLLTQLKGIQLGKLKDELKWCFAVTEEDGKKVVGETQNGTNGTNEQTIDQLD